MAKRPTTAQKLAALKARRELPVDPRALALDMNVGEVLGTDEKAVLTLAREYQKEEEPEHTAVSWANQERAAAYFNQRGLIATLDEIVRVGGPEALA